MIDASSVNRLVIVNYREGGNRGRIVDMRDCEIELMLLDDQRTMKVFIYDREETNV